MAKTHDTCVLLFAKTPVPGLVKTRLIPVLGPAGATALYKALLRHKLNQLARLADMQVQLWHTADPLNYWQTFSPAVHRLRQVSGDLGVRMGFAARWALQHYPQVILIGVDSPTLDEAYLRQAQRLLKRADVVVGPALDGGYVLLGLKQYQPELFRHISWGSEQVLQQTMAAARHSGNTIAQLAALPDIDTEEDLHYLPKGLYAVQPA